MQQLQVSRPSGSVSGLRSPPADSMWQTAQTRTSTAIPIAQASAHSTDYLFLRLLPDISYTLPVVYLLLNHKRFEAIKGPFNLGKFSRPCGLVAICYTSFLTVVFCLPTLTPINKETLNYTPVAVGIVAGEFSSERWPAAER